MRRALAAGSLALTATLMSGTAVAQDFGRKMDVVFSADRLVGIHFSHVDSELPAPASDYEQDITGFGFGWRGGAQPTPFDVPRFAFDIFVIERLSVGGALGFATYSADDDDNYEHASFLLAPRVGYVWMFSDVAGFWLRGCFTYHSGDRDLGPGDRDDWGLALTVEPTFVLSPVRNFAFVVGPTVDLDVTGEYEVRDRDGIREYDRRYRSIGIQAGLLGWF
jgi:hypothetical protein